MSITKQEMIEALREASKSGYFGGMGTGGGAGFSGGSSPSTGSSGGGAGQWGKELSAAGDAAKGFGSAALSAGSKIAEGGARLGDVTQALSAGFSGLGASGSVLGASLDKGSKALNSLGQNIDQNVDTWRKLSDTGLAFGNDIMEMKNQASAARMSIAEMSEVMQKNNSAMLGFGATSAASAKQLSKMSNEFFTSGLGEQLRGMGYTTKELNDVLAVSISGSKIKDLNDEKSRDKALKSASALATEMDAVAKITGQSKQEQLDELRRKAMDGQRMAAIDEAIARGGEGAKEAFDAISANGKLMGPQFQKLAEDMASMGRPSEGMEQAYGLLSSGAKKLMSEAGEAARSGDRERAAQLTKQAAAEQAAFQQTSQYRTMAAQAGIKETQESYAQGAKFRNALEAAGKELGPMATDSEKTAAALKKLDEQVKAEQQAGGKDDPAPTAGASITRFAVDLESRGRDLTKVLNDQVIQPLAKDIGPTLGKLSKDLKLGSSTVVQDQIGAPMKAGYDKARIARTVAEEGEKSGGAMSKDSPLHKDLMEFGSLIKGNQKQSDTTISVLNRLAAEQSKATGKTVTAEDVAKNATNTPGAMADIVKQIKRELPANQQPDRSESDRTKKDKITHVTGDKAEKPASETLGSMVEFAGSLFKSSNPGFVTVTNLGGPYASGGIVTKPEIALVGEAGPEAIFNKSQLEDYTAKIMGSAAGSMPKIDMPKFDMSSMSKSISTSISSVTGGGTTTTKRVQSDDSKQAEQELLALEKTQREEKQKLVNQLKEEGIIKGKFATGKDNQNIPQLAALNEKQAGERDALTKRVDAGTSIETVVEQAKAETTKMVTEQLAITKSSNSKLTSLWEEESNNKIERVKQDNTDLLKQAELAKGVIGSSVKGMSDDMLEAMIPKGAKIEDYYIDMNDKIQSFSADAAEKLKASAKDSTSVFESYSTTISSSSKKISADIADALPIKEVAAKQEEFKSQFTESQQKIIDDYKGYSEENRSFHAQAMENGIKEDTETAKMIGDRISKMKAAIGDRQATEEEQAELANQEANKAMFERQVESKKEMLDVMQNLGEYSAKRELELKQKAANDAIAIEDKKAEAIKADISTELPIDTEFGNLDKAIADQKSMSDAAAMDAFYDAGPAVADKKETAAPKKSIADMMSGLSFGPNGMPIMKSIDAAKKTIAPPKPAESDTVKAAAEAKAKEDAKKASGEKKSETKAATKEATLDDLLKSMNALNTKVAQLIAVNEDGHRSTAKAAKSNAGNIYER